MRRRGGKQVWSETLTAAERATSISKHEQYYRILGCLVDTLESQFGLCLLYDIHSYNYQRIEHETPVFNLGTGQINTRKWSKEVDQLLGPLGNIELPNIQVDTGVNSVFRGGQGYQATFIKENFANTLILPIEVKKIFMNEVGGVRPSPPWLSRN